jgi:hypothetical protein
VLIEEWSGDGGKLLTDVQFFAFSPIKAPAALAIAWATASASFATIGSIVTNVCE